MASHGRRVTLVTMVGDPGDLSGICAGPRSSSMGWPMRPTSVPSCNRISSPPGAEEGVGSKVEGGGVTMGGGLSKGSWHAGV
jgi:hypothetical protein